jgi:hypothetical protein
VPTTALSRGGVAGLVAGALFLASAMTSLLFTIEDPFGSTTGYVQQSINLLAFVAAAGAAAGLAVLLRSTGRMPALALVGAVLTSGAYLAVALLNVVDLMQGERSLVVVRVAAAGVLIIGSALLGVLVLITRAVPWWCGVLLIVAFPLGDVANALFGGAESVLLALLWGTVGIALVRRARAADEPLGAAARSGQVVR